MNHLVSIIIPVYNVENYIIPCLESVVKQTYKHIEIIIVNDCGTDKSMQLIKAFIVKYQNLFTFRIINHKHNQGLSAARNTGTSEAKGEYIFYLDSDDMITPNCIELLVNKAIQVDADMVTADYQTIGGKDFFDGHLKQDSADIFIGADILDAYCKGLYNVTAWNKLIRYNFIKSHHVKFIENILHEDDPWSMEMAYKLKKVALIKTTTYLYVIRKESISNKVNIEKKINSMRILMEYSFKLIKQHPEFANSKSLFEFNINRLLNYLYYTYDNLRLKGIQPYLANIDEFKYKSKYFSVTAKNLHITHRMWLLMYYIPKNLRPLYFKIIVLLRNIKYGNKSINNTACL